MDDLVLRLDVRRQDKGKRGKFDNLWFGPFKISDVLENNTFLLKNIDDEQLSSGLVNGHFLKHFFTYESVMSHPLLITGESIVCVK